MREELEGKTASDPVLGELGWRGRWDEEHGWQIEIRNGEVVYDWKF